MDEVASLKAKLKRRDITIKSLRSELSLQGNQIENMRDKIEALDILRNDFRDYLIRWLRLDDYIKTIIKESLS